MHVFGVFGMVHGFLGSEASPSVYGRSRMTCFRRDMLPRGREEAEDADNTACSSTKDEVVWGGISVRENGRDFAISVHRINASGKNQLGRV